MSEANELELQAKGIRLQVEIDGKVGDLVSHAEKLIADRLDKVKQIEGSQLRNVMAVANTAPHPAVVVNFIRYQIGRSATAKAWKDTGLGDAVIALIDVADHCELNKLAKQAVSEAKCGEVFDVQMQMIRLLLGFMNRRFVYEKDKIEPEKQK